MAGPQLDPRPATATGQLRAGVDHDSPKDGGPTARDGVAHPAAEAEPMANSCVVSTQRSFRIIRIMSSVNVRS